MLLNTVSRTAAITIQSSKFFAISFKGLSPFVISFSRQIRIMTVVRFTMHSDQPVPATVIPVARFSNGHMQRTNTYPAEADRPVDVAIPSNPGLFQEKPSEPRVNGARRLTWQQ